MWPANRPNKERDSSAIDWTRLWQQVRYWGWLLTKKQKLKPKLLSLVPQALKYRSSPSAYSLAALYDPLEGSGNQTKSYWLDRGLVNNLRALPPNTVISDLSETDKLTFHRRGSCWCRRPTSCTLLNLQTRNNFWEAPSVVAFQWLSTLLTASLECSDLDSTTYSQIEAVLDPVEVAKLLWPGKTGMLTDNYQLDLDNGLALKPSR